MGLLSVNRVVVRLDVRGIAVSFLMPIERQSIDRTTNCKLNVGRNAIWLVRTQGQSSNRRMGREHEPAGGYLPELIEAV